MSQRRIIISHARTKRDWVRAFAESLRWETLLPKWLQIIASTTGSLHLNSAGEQTLHKAVLEIVPDGEGQRFHNSRTFVLLQAGVVG